MKFKFLGHASVQVDLGGNVIVFDPFISANEHAKHIEVKDIKAEYVLLTHGHGDHILDAEQIAKQCDGIIVSNYEVSNHFEKKGCKVHPLNHGGTFVGNGFKAKYVNAIHTSSFPDGSYAGQPGGFVVTSESGNFYHAGDTALTYDMKLIGESCNLDVALLPIGGNFTMDMYDAVKAAEFVNCKKVIGIHYDTFGFIEIDHDEAKRIFREAGIELLLLNIGEEVEL